ncbi:hypothetical protein QUB56_32925 [Microcoleus sp. AR_TQ3_B6]|uniref:hypothetical protein n=1 Tax=Microcoleus sp. AR_TQ3_B6 TaxID=3055284 RepID=UPI002FD0A2EB
MHNSLAAFGQHQGDDRLYIRGIVSCVSARFWWHWEAMRSRGVVFARDVTWVRYAAALGFKMGFLERAIETWNEWGRSI